MCMYVCTRSLSPLSFLSSATRPCNLHVSRVQAIKRRVTGWVETGKSQFEKPVKVTPDLPK